MFSFQNKMNPKDIQSVTKYKNPTFQITQTENVRR